VKRGELGRVKKVGTKRTGGAFHLSGKTGFSVEKSNGTRLSTGNFFEKFEYLQGYSSLFLVFT